MKSPFNPSLQRTIALAMTGLLLTGCASERIIYRPVPVPVGLIQAVEKPPRPDPKTATQKDVGVFLIEQNAAIDACNEQLKLIKNWSKQHNGRSR